MKSLYFFIGVFVCFHQLSAQSGLTIQVCNFHKPTGEIEFCLYQNTASYMYAEKAVFCEFVSVSGTELVHTFGAIDNGAYVVVVFQDLNNNRELDTNFMRIPKEPYGFSNNPSMIIDPPSFDEASFIITGDAKIEITL